jgi:hypothetical protein
MRVERKEEVREGKEEGREGLGARRCKVEREKARKQR